MIYVNLNITGDILDFTFDGGHVISKTILTTRNREPVDDWYDYAVYRKYVEAVRDYLYERNKDITLVMMRMFETTLFTLRMK